MKVCSVMGCQKPASAKGWCGKHYHRWRKHGSPHTTLIAPQGLRDAFIRAICLYTGAACIFWPFPLSRKGYGVCNEGQAHRIVCSQTHGPPPSPKHEAAHSCGNGHLGCITPSHLRWATHAENEADKVAHGTTNRGEKSARHVLREAEVRAIRAASGSQPQLAEQFGVSRSQIGKILARKTWSWLD